MPDITLTQLLVETLATVPASPVAASQVAAEFFYANPNDTRVTLICCEVLIIPRKHVKQCPSQFPID